MKSRLLTHFLLSVLLGLHLARAVPQPRDSSQVRTVRILPELVQPRDKFPNLVRWQPIKRPKVALVLSGGGARGVATIGVLQSFNRHHIPIDLIVGTSMGSIVGGLFASGYTPSQLQRLVDTTDWDHVISYSDESARRDLFLDQKNRNERSFLTVRFKGFMPIIPSAFSTGQRLTNLLNFLSLQALYHPDPSFDDLKIPFRAVSTDLVSGKQVVMGKGDLSEAMRASMTVPLLFTPVTKDSMELVDGGLISNIPVDVARNLGGDIVVAVDVTSPLRPRGLLTQFWEVGDQIMGIMMQASNREQLAKADIVIRPDLERHLSSDFSDLDSVISQGEKATDALSAEIESTIASKRIAAKSDGGVFKHPVLVNVSPELSPEASAYLRSLTDTGFVTQSELQMFVDDLYATGDYDSVCADVRRANDSSSLSVTAKRFPVLTSVTVHGNSLIPTDTILGVFKPLLRKNINARETRDALRDVLRLYRREGYSLANFRSVHYSPDSGTVDLDINEGIIYRMDIRGTTNTKDYVIWRELPFGREDVFRIQDVTQGVRNLNGTNLFEQVSVGTHVEGQNDVVDINIK
jgi:NTE family protein